jgi:hypothetical protein
MRKVNEEKKSAVKDIIQSIIWLLLPLGIIYLLLII